MYQTRKYTNMLLELLEAGVLDKDNVILACMCYMSEDDVKDMCEKNEYIEWMNYRDEPYATERNL